MDSDTLGLFAGGADGGAGFLAAAGAEPGGSAGAFSGMDDFFGGGPSALPSAQPTAGGDIFGLDALLGADSSSAGQGGGGQSAPALLAPPPGAASGGSSTSALLSGTMASLGLESAWGPAEQRWIADAPKLGFLATERLALPVAPPAVDGPTQAALAALRAT